MLPRSFFKFIHSSLGRHNDDVLYDSQCIAKSQPSLPIQLEPVARTVSSRPRQMGTSAARLVDRHRKAGDDKKDQFSTTITDGRGPGDTMIQENLSQTEASGDKTTAESSASLVMQDSQVQTVRMSTLAQLMPSDPVSAPEVASLTITSLSQVVSPAAATGVEAGISAAQWSAPERDTAFAHISSHQQSARHTSSRRKRVPAYQKALQQRRDTDGVTSGIDRTVSGNSTSKPSLQRYFAMLSDSSDEDDLHVRQLSTTHVETGSVTPDTTDTARQVQIDIMDTSVSWLD